MSSAYFASLVTMPVIITEPGKYLTRSGDTVTIEQVSTKHDLGCTGHYSCGVPERWHKSGRLFSGMESFHDIISKA